MSVINYRWIRLDEIGNTKHVIPDNSWPLESADSGHCLLSWNEHRLVVTLQGTDKSYLTKVVCLNSTMAIIIYRGTAAIVDLKYTDNQKCLPIHPCIGCSHYYDYLLVWSFNEVACIVSFEIIRRYQAEVGEIKSIYATIKNTVELNIEKPWGDYGIIALSVPELNVQNLSPE